MIIPFCIDISLRICNNENYWPQFYLSLQLLLSNKYYPHASEN